MSIESCLLTSIVEGTYKLSWERQRIERFRILRPGKNLDNHSVVMARFESGWNLVCLYIAPMCKGFAELPQ